MIIGILILTPIAWYLASPLFIDEVVDEELPFETSNEVIENEVVLEDNEGEEQTDKVGESSNVEIVSSFTGEFNGADKVHKVKGSAKVLESGDQSFLRFEDFESTNGPDLYVYLATDTTAQDFVSLGTLKGNVGNQNYELDGVDLEKYDNVLIWCQRFGVLFGHAELE